MVAIPASGTGISKLRPMTKRDPTDSRLYAASPTLNTVPWFMCIAAGTPLSAVVLLDKALPRR
jgi:hypothetical protein